ncbi:PREDICTED: uncharacterized protein LOC109385938 isoform X1 [Hipposideros armiger]|uniref:Uncharacterized protein LOC109385938 isoform X1 n=2 Tax=Hipposideros armiger TaxID=186990 RepID=A0A8B7RYH0_HIPAR|nr:PREDICTED: uncharacterized protein LOC109385938 isoform X1 [Hipposideros armiger]
MTSRYSSTNPAGESGSAGTSRGEQRSTGRRCSPVQRAGSCPSGVEKEAVPFYAEEEMDSVTWRKSHGTSVVYPQGFSLPFVAPQKPTQAGAGGNSPFRFSNGGRTGELRPRRAGGRREPAEKKGSGEKGFWASAAAVEAAPRRHANSRKPREVSGLCSRRRRLNPTRRGILDLPSAPRVQLLNGLALSCPMDASSSLRNPTPAPVSSPSLLLPIPAIVFIAVGIYLLLLGLVLLTRHCLLAQGCCANCSSPCRKQGASRTQDCCWACAEACNFPLPSPAHCLDACCPQPTEAGWAPRCPRCCPLCDCACACQLPDCQSLNCLCFEIKLR